MRRFLTAALFALALLCPGESLRAFFLPPVIFATAGATGPTLVFNTVLSSTTGGGGVKAGVTYSSVPISTAAANRTIILAAALRENGIQTIATITVGGVSATNVGRACNSGTFATCMDIWVAAVTTGTTATIVVTYSASVDAADGLGVWSAYGLTSSTPTATANSFSTTAPSLNLNVSAGGLVVAASWTIQVPSVACAAWTGVAPQGEVLGDPGTSPAEFFDVASASNLTAGAPRTVGCTYNGTSTNEPVAFAASFR